MGQADFSSRSLAEIRHDIDLLTRLHPRMETAFFGELSYTFELANGQQLELMGGIRNYDLKDDIHTEVSVTCARSQR